MKHYIKTKILPLTIFLFMTILAGCENSKDEISMIWVNSPDINWENHTELALDCDCLPCINNYIEHGPIIFEYTNIPIFDFSKGLPEVWPDGIHEYIIYYPKNTFGNEQPSAVLRQVKGTLLIMVLGLGTVQEVDIPRGGAYAYAYGINYCTAIISIADAVARIPLCLKSFKVALP